MIGTTFLIVLPLPAPWRGNTSNPTTIFGFEAGGFGNWHFVDVWSLALPFLSASIGGVRGAAARVPAGLTAGGGFSTREFSRRQPG